MRFGIDLGGTKIEVLALADDGAVRLRRRVATPRGDYGAIVRAIADLVRSAEGEIGQSGPVGVGIPGSVSPATGLVRNANTTELIGHAFDRDLGQALARSVRVENDANCFALSEASDGAGAGAGVVFAVIIGTGVGAGLVVNGAVVRGANAIAGEWGHNPLPRMTPDETATAPRCYCGRHHCIETFLSGPGLAADFARTSGRSLSAPEIVAAMQAGDRPATAAFDRYVDRLARALSTIVNVVDPDAIVLGGGMGNVAALYDLLPKAMAPHVFTDVWQARIVRPAHGDSSGVRGAAWLHSKA